MKPVLLDALQDLGDVQPEPLVLHELCAVHSLVKIVAVYIADDADLSGLLAYDLCLDGPEEDGETFSCRLSTSAAELPHGDCFTGSTR